MIRGDAILTSALHVLSYPSEEVWIGGYSIVRGGAYWWCLGYSIVFICTCCNLLAPATPLC